MLMPRVLGVCLIATSCLLMPGPAAAQGTPAVTTKAERELPESERQSLIDAVVRLPLAAAKHLAMPSSVIVNSSSFQATGEQESGVPSL